MSFLGTNDMELFRRIHVETLKDTCTISRATLAADGMGGHTETWATVATVACRLNTSGTRPNETATADQIRNNTDFIITVPNGTDVRNADRITIGSRTFEVVKPRVLTWKTALRVQVVEVM